MQVWLFLCLLWLSLGQTSRKPHLILWGRIFFFLRSCLLEDTSLFPFFNFCFSPSLLPSWVDSALFRAPRDSLVLSAGSHVHFRGGRGMCVFWRDCCCYYQYPGWCRISENTLSCLLVHLIQIRYKTFWRENEIVKQKTRLHLPVAATGSSTSKFYCN